MRNPQVGLTCQDAAQILRSEPDLAFFHTFRDRTSPAAFAAGSIPTGPCVGYRRDFKHGTCCHGIGRMDALSGMTLRNATFCAATPM